MTLTSPDLELFGHPDSGHACKVALALTLAGLRYRTHLVDIWAAPGIGDCAVWGYTQWLDAAGVEGSPLMLAWIERMRKLPAMRDPSGFFPG